MEYKKLHRCRPGCFSILSYLISKFAHSEIPQVSEYRYRTYHQWNKYKDSPMTHCDLILIPGDNFCGGLAAPYLICQQLIVRTNIHGLGGSKKNGGLAQWNEWNTTYFPI